ncbi:hypothetical protein [Pelosinus fermentans]|uniref:hypothetical protein n=1 Tax=Pelosinus fermentans TaxID=365349 RepID=UPI00055F5EB8|nr:hypothetical protein [Pelosinus fermentans]
MNPIAIVSATLRYITNVQNVIMSVRTIGINALSVIMTSMMNASVLNVTRNVTKIVISAHGVVMIFIMTVVDIIVASALWGALIMQKK